MLYCCCISCRHGEGFRECLSRYRGMSRETVDVGASVSTAGELRRLHVDDDSTRSCSWFASPKRTRTQLQRNRQVKFEKLYFRVMYPSMRSFFSATFLTSIFRLSAVLLSNPIPLPLRLPPSRDSTWMGKCRAERRGIDSSPSDRVSKDNCSAVSRTHYHNRPVFCQICFFDISENESSSSKPCFILSPRRRSGSTMLGSMISSVLGILVDCMPNYDQEATTDT